jgi:hypothetical protein
MSSAFSEGRSLSKPRVPADECQGRMPRPKLSALGIALPRQRGPREELAGASAH